MATDRGPTEAPPVGRRDRFRAAAAWATGIVGSPWAFFLAVLTVLAWAASGPLFGYSETWQLVINTGTTIVTFLMVFLIQNAQNRESKALHLKLDELIFAATRADNTLIDAESLTDAQLDRLARHYHRVGERYHREIEAEIEAIGRGLEDQVEEVEGHVEEVEGRVEEVEGRVTTVERTVERNGA